MTQCLKCSAPRPDSGAKFLILMENRQKIEFDKDLGSPNPIWNFTTDFTKGSQWKNFKLKKSMFVLIIWHQWPSVSTHTVLAINKFFRQIKAKIYQFCSNHIIKIHFFWEKVFIPNHSKHDGLLVYWPKFIQFSHEITFGRGKSRIWVLEVNIWTPFFSKFDYFHQKTKTWSTLPSCSEPSA